MKRLCILLSASLFLFVSSNLKGQNLQLSLSGTYGIIVNDLHPEVQYKAIGTSLGFEVKLKKHLSLGGEVDWQGFEPEEALAQPATNPNIPTVIYSIIRYQFNLRPTLRYYFRESFRGLYVGVFSTYSYLTVKTSNFPQDPSYLPSIYTDPTDDFGFGLGLTYGYRLKLTKHLRASAFGSHQLFKNDIPAYKQQDHQFGLGLNWIF